MEVIKEEIIYYTVYIDDFVAPYIHRVLIKTNDGTLHYIAKRTSNKEGVSYRELNSLLIKQLMKNRDMM